MGLDKFQVYDRDLPDSVVAEYLVSDQLAVDTETMGLLPCRDRLCLVQLCDREGHVSVIRIERGQKHATNLKKLLESETVLKVFHFARFDMATLRYHLDIKVSPVFCTKMASKLVRTYTQKHGLKDVVQELEKIELDKTSQSSDWGNARHLSEAQLSYAANDVRYLLPVQQKLKAMLEREERWQLAQECFNCLPVFVSLDLMQYKDIFEH